MDKRIIEINGTKIEVDLRSATVIEKYTVGQTVKLLKKYYDSWRVLPAVIVGFAEFKNLPTIELIAIDTDGSIVKVAYNSESKDIEIAEANKYDYIFSKADVLTNLDRTILAKQEEVRNLIQKRDAFVEAFGKVIDGLK